MRRFESHVPAVSLFLTVSCLSQPYPRIPVSGLTCAAVTRVAISQRAALQCTPLGSLLEEEKRSGRALC